jgi:branched-chain amino acid aminotransferase
MASGYGSWPDEQAALQMRMRRDAARQRAIALLRHDSTEVREASLTWSDVADADEIFATGNLAKVQACTRLENRELPEGPISKRARELYFGWAESCPL